MIEFLPDLLTGALVTLRIAAVASALAILMAFSAGLARLSSSLIVRTIAITYVEFFRGTSLLVQLFWMFFVLPNFGIFLEPFLVAVLALGLNIGAYGSEVVRASILAVPRGQTEAAIALNMSPALRMKRIIAPQALITMMLPWSNLLIILLKSTSLVSLITIHDLTFRAYSLNGMTFRTWELYSLSLILYFLMAQVIALGISALYRRMSRGLVRGSI